MHSHHVRALRALKIAEEVGDKLKQDRQGKTEAPFKPPAQNLAEELIQGLAVPPAFHIGLTQPKVGKAQNAAIQFVVVNLNIPGTGPVNGDINRSQHFFNV